MALTAELPSYLFLHRALAISGSSKYTTGGAWGAADGNRDRGAGYRQFLTEGNMPFHADVPLTADGAYPPSCVMLVYECYRQSEFLRSGGSVHPPGAVLERALADPLTVIDHAANEAWGRRFAAHHGLDFATHLRASRRLRLRMTLRAAVARVRSALNCIVVDGSHVAMRNVFEASVVAGAMAWVRPSVPVRLWRAYEYRFGAVRRERLRADLAAARATGT